MKVLILAQGQLDRRLGGARATMDLATHLRELGVDVACESDTTLREKTGSAPSEPAQVVVTRYLERFGPFEVLEYDHAAFALDARELSPKLVVTRVSLLLLHFGERPVPDDPRPIVRLKKALQPWRYQWAFDRLRRMTTANLRSAHGVIVHNRQDAARVAQLGIASKRIAVTYPGLLPGFQASLAQVANAPRTQPPSLTFIGTFEFRKGCLDFAQLFPRLAAAIPGIRLRLLGTKGLMQTEEEVRSFFPANLQAQIDVVPRFAPDALPGLLAGASLGIFPSYLESFGYGALEMMQAGVPVVAYDVPGPADFVPADCLVPAGDVAALEAKIRALLADSAALEATRALHLAAAAPYTAPALAQQTLTAYQHWLAQLPTP